MYIIFHSSRNPLRDGQVFDEYIVQLTSGKLLRLPELGSRLVVGESGTVRHLLFPLHLVMYMLP